MSEDKAEILDFLSARLSRRDARFDRIDQKLHEAMRRLSVLERDLCAMKIDFAGMYVRLHNVIGRLDGFESPMPEHPHQRRPVGEN